MPIDVRRAESAGQTIWWLNAALAQTCSPDEAASMISGTFHGLGNAPITGAATIGAMRARGFERLSLAVVESGDPVGLPGPAPVTREAVAAGLAAVSADGTLTIIPASGEPPLIWLAVPSTSRIDPVAQFGSVGEAQSLMREGMLEISNTMPDLEPDDTALAELAEYRSWRPPLPPPQLPPRAAQLAEAALRVWWLTGVARELSQRQGLTLSQQLRELRPLARRAVAAAFSIQSNPTPSGDTG